MDKKTSKKVASKAGDLLGLTRAEYMHAFDHWYMDCERIPTANDCARWAWRHLSGRARSVAASALAQRSPDRKRRSSKKP